MAKDFQSGIRKLSYADASKKEKASESAQETRERKTDSGQRK
jgi:hypothetical protein